MRKLAPEERKQCEAQGEIFAASTRSFPGGSAVFVRRFMRSKLAARLDRGAFVVETISPEQALNELAGEYGNRAYGSDAYSADEMYWMGYLYRYWCLAGEIPSKAAYKTIGARELRSLYAPYHSLAVDAAIERIMEAKGLEEETPVERGVRLLKKIQHLLRIDLNFSTAQGDHADPFTHIVPPVFAPVTRCNDADQHEYPASYDLFVQVRRWSSSALSDPALVL